MISGNLMKKILIATSNLGKFKQIEKFLHGLPIEFLSLKNFSEIKNEPEENAETFEDNAKIKAEFYFKKTGLPVIAEDSGILVNALPGELGVKTRRWGAGSKASDKEWIEYFLQTMRNVPDGKREAKFVSFIVLAHKNGMEVFSGECAGTITKTLEAKIVDGIPLSSCFKPDGYNRVYSSLSLEEKMKVSHRGKASSKLKDFLINF